MKKLYVFKIQYVGEYALGVVARDLDHAIKLANEEDPRLDPFGPENLFYRVGVSRSEPYGIKFLLGSE